LDDGIPIRWYRLRVLDDVVGVTTAAREPFARPFITGSGYGMLLTTILHLAGAIEYGRVVYGVRGYAGATRS
jgi:hypothetical protein